MAVKRNDPYESNVTNDEILRRRTAQLDNELQPDPELAEGRAGGGRITLFAIAIIAILGVVFYGLNNPSTAPTSTAQTTTTSPATPPAGQTTGSATSTQTSPPPASTPPISGQSGDNANSNTTDGSSGSSSTPSMTPAPSPSNGGTTQSGPPANN
jgi:hypothetical protein